MLIELHSDYPEYLWYPEVLDNALHSAEYLAEKLNLDLASGSLEISEEKLKRHINENYVEKWLRITDATDAELQRFVDNPPQAVYYFAELVSRRAQVGFSTHGHSAVDVNIYGTVGTERLSGNHENTDVGKFLREYLEVEVDDITKELVEATKSFHVADKDTAWTGKIPSEEDIKQVLNNYENLYGPAP